MMMMMMMIVTLAAAAMAPGGPAGIEPVPLPPGEYGPCSTAKIGHLRPGISAPVRARPSPHARVVARLADDANVYACVRRGDWFGIIFQHPWHGSDCHLGPARRTTGIYRGRCRMGWVHDRNIFGYADFVSP